MKNKKTFLYVLLLPQMNEKRELGYMVKFGYTENFENRMKNGYNQYHSYVEVLHLYEGNFTMEDETRLKQYFREKDYIFTRDEYLRFIPEVLEFFDTYDTTDRLKEKISQLPIMSKNGRQYYSVDDLYISCILNQRYPKLRLVDRQDLRVKLYKVLRNYCQKEQIIYIQSTYNITKNTLLEYVEKFSVDQSQISEEVKDMFETFSDFTKSKEKLKYLVEISEKGLLEEDLTNFLSLIPERYREYYTEMGPDRIKANSYQESKLKAEWSKQHQEELGVSGELVQKIIDYFKLGHRFSRTEIKEKLKEMYQESRYDKTAKASDIKEYLWTKDVKFLEDGKWVNGYEIIGKK